jgi:hypothetical protein
MVAAADAREAAAQSQQRDLEGRVEGFRSEVELDLLVQERKVPACCPALSFLPLMMLLLMK